MISREFLDSVRCTEDIVYKTSGGHRLLLDLYGPARPSGLPGPLLLLLHGGGWFRQSKKTEIVPRFLNTVGADLINGHGWQIAAVEYRMLREHAVFPDQLTDCCDAARFFIKHADQYHVDPRNIFAAGSSAGGYAAIMMTSETERWKDAPELASLHVDLAAAVSFSGVLDTAWIVESGDRKVDETGDGRIRYCMQCLLSPQRLHDRELWKESSPRSYLHAGSAPALLVYGTADSLVTPDHAADFFRYARSLGLDWEELPVINGEHNFAPATAETPTSPDRLTIYRTARDFLLRHVRR